MEGDENSSNNHSGALNFGESNVADTIQLPQQNVQANNDNAAGAGGSTEGVVDYLTQIDWTFNPSDASGGSLSHPMETGGSSLDTNHQEGPKEVAPAPGSGGITIGESSSSSSVANEAGGATSVQAGFQASPPAQGAAATGPAGHWDPMRSLSQLQPVMPPFFYGQGNPSSLEARLSSSSSTLTNGFSDMWCPLTPSQQTNLFRTTLSSAGTRTSNTLMLPEIHPENNHSSSAENPFSFHEFCSFAMSYMREIEAREHPEWMMDDRFFDDITDASIDDSAGGEFVDDPMESSWYERSYDEPHILPPPADVFGSQTGRRSSEMQNDGAQGNANRRGPLRTEELSTVQRSMLHHVPEEMADVDGADLSFDIDNMSYEQLLDLEDNIGYVSSGLVESTISAHVTCSYFESLHTEPAAGLGELCCICQEEYTDGDELAKLECRHEFHFACIKKWLFQKNECPICKRTAINFTSFF